MIRQFVNENGRVLLVSPYVIRKEENEKRRIALKVSYPRRGGARVLSLGPEQAEQLHKLLGAWLAQDSSIGETRFETGEK